MTDYDLYDIGATEPDEDEDETVGLLPPLPRSNAKMHPQMIDMKDGPPAGFVRVTPEMKIAQAKAAASPGAPKPAAPSFGVQELVDMDGPPPGFVKVSGGKTPGFFEAIAREAGRQQRAIQSGAAAAFNREMPQGMPSKLPPFVEEQPLGWRDVQRPREAAAKIGAAIGGMAPFAMGGFAGGLAGGAAGPLGGIAGGALGAGGVSALQTLGKAYPEELAAIREKKLSAWAMDDAIPHTPESMNAASTLTPEDFNAAFDAASLKAGISGAAGGIGWAAFGLPIKDAAARILAQSFAVQPGVMEAEKAAQNVAAGRPITEGLGEDYAKEVAGTAIPMGLHASLGLWRGRQPEPQVSPEPQQPGGLPGGGAPGVAPPSPGPGPGTSGGTGGGAKPGTAGRGPGTGGGTSGGAPPDLGEAVRGWSGPAREDVPSFVAGMTPENRYLWEGLASDAGMAHRSGLHEAETVGRILDQMDAAGRTGPKYDALRQTLDKRLVDALRAAREYFNSGGMQADEIRRAQEQADAARAQEEAARGSRARPTGADDIDAARSKVNTEPSDAQKEAGNYQKGHVRNFDGLDISIENPVGSTRRGVSPDGTPWEAQLPADYGYIKGSKASDGDQVDIFLGPKGPTGTFYVIDQHDPQTGKFDEPKVFGGVASPAEALDLYTKAFSDGSGLSRFGAIHEVPAAWLKSMIQSGAIHKPFAQLPPPSEGELEQGETISAIQPPAAARARKQKEAPPQSLISFLKQNGGIKDIGGDLRAQEIHRRYPGLINNKSGMTPDRAREKAAEAGYLGGDIEAAISGTVADDLTQAILAHPTYSVHDETRVAELEGERKTKAHEDRIKAYRGHVDRHLEDNGLADVFDDRLRNEAARIMVEEDMDEAEALDLATIRDYASNKGAIDELSDEWERFRGKFDEDAKELYADLFSERPAERPAERPKDQVPPSRGASGAGESQLHGEEEGAGPAGKAPRRAPEGEEARRPVLTPGDQRTHEASIQSSHGFKVGDTVTVEGRTGGVSTIISMFERELIKGRGTPLAKVEFADGHRLIVNASALRAAAAPSYEPGAEGKPQSVIPGAEKAKPKTMAEREAERPLRGKGAQAAPGGMFDEGETAPQLFDQPAKPAEEEDLSLANKIVDTKFVSNPAVEGPDGRGWRIKKEGDGFIVLRMPPRDGTTGKPPTGALPEHIRPPKGETWTDLEAARQAAAIANERARAGEPAKKTENAASTVEAGDIAGSPSWRVANHLLAKGRMTRKEAQELTGYDLRDPRQIKLAEETVELGVVRAAREIATKLHADDPAAAYKRLVQLYDDQPSLTSRTSTSVAQQAYSTPAPLAYVAAKLSGIGEGQDVFEPSAGNGMLLITADPKNAVANELNGNRRYALEDQGFKTADMDATEADVPRKAEVMNDGFKFNRVIANPPFGSIKEDGKAKIFDLARFQAGYKTREIDHVIALNALDAMADNGRAALILGGLNKLTTNRAEGYGRSKAKREFFLHLYNTYNVTDHFTVSGDLYAKQGASWPVDVIVIDGRGKSALDYPFVTAPREIASWDELGDLLKGSLDELRGRETEPGGSGAATGARVPGVGPGPDGGRSSISERPLETSGDAIPRPGYERPGDLRPGGVPGEREAGRGSKHGSSRGGSGGGNRGGARRRPDAPIPESIDPEPPPEDLSKPSFYRAFNDVQRARFEAGSDVNKEHALRFGFLLDRMRERGADAERIANLEKKLNDILHAVMGPAPEEGAADGGARGRRRTWTDFSEAERKERARKRQEWAERQQAKERERKERQTERKKTEPKEAPAPEEAQAPEQTDIETEGQAPYTPHATRTKGLGTLVPKNMRDAINVALSGVKARHGNLDDYVRVKTGLSSQGWDRKFSAEQVDALAMAIDNLDQGKGFIIGDQTGVGKGRVNAGIIAYAIERGLIPVFVTEKPNLYGDMYRDIRDIGIEEALGRDPRFIMTNSDVKVPLDEDGTVILKKEKNHDEVLELIAQERKMPDHDILFTTYDQMNPVMARGRTGGETTRRDLLRNIAPNAIFIFDEAHNVGERKDRKGNKAGMAPLRGNFFRSLVRSAKGVFYSSATYAKRPGNMDFYSATDMALAVANPEDLGNAIEKGGVPMQEVVAAMLAESGQYIRRERSFAGVSYDTQKIPVIEDEITNFSHALRSIYQFSEWLKEGPIKALDADVKAEGQAVSGARATGRAAVESVAFASLMHNVIGQFLLAQKADATASLVIDAINRGERPIVALTNTMDGFIEEYMGQTGANVGDVANVSFNDILLRYLDRTRNFTRRRPFSDEVESGYLSDDQIGPVGMAMFDEAKERISQIDFGGIPVSPIDYLKEKVRQSGFSMGEITGRANRIDYSTPLPTFAKRTSKETGIAARRETIRRFQSGSDHGIIINAAGSTGLSLHDDARNKTKWPKGVGRRRMFIMQANPDINVHMQTLGRAHRTGQMTLPAFVQLISDTPAEVRIAAVLQSKMASLNANTTASKEGALSAKVVPDILNDYGNYVASMVMHEEPDLHEKMGEPLTDRGRNDDRGAMTIITGHISMLSYPEQVALMDRLVSAYEDLIRTLEEAGENVLSSKPLALDAKPLSSMTVVKKTGESPFQGAVQLDEYDTKSDRKPIKFKDVVKEAATAADIDGQFIPDDAAEAIRKIRKSGHLKTVSRLAAANAAFVPYRDLLLGKRLDEEIRAATDEKLQEQKNHVVGVANILYVGNLVSAHIADGSIATGYVVDQYRDMRTQNPYAASDWKAKIAVPGIGFISFPFSKLSMEEEKGRIKVEHAAGTSVERMSEMYDAFSGDIREKRVIATGNLLAAFDFLGGRGKITHFELHDGKIAQGIIMPRDVTSVDDLARSSRVNMRSGAEVIQNVRRDRPIFDGSVNIEISMDRYGDYTIAVPAARATGGKYYLEPSVLDAATTDFVKRGDRMKIEGVSAARAAAVVDAMMKVGAKFWEWYDPDDGGGGTHAAPVPRGWEAMEPVPPSHTYEEAVDIASSIFARVLPQGVKYEFSRGASVKMDPRSVEASAARHGLKASDMPWWAGLYNVGRKLVRLALGWEGFEETAFHEAWHATEDAGLPNERERKVLTAPGEVARMRKLIARKAGNRTADAMAETEVRATAAGMVARAIEHGEPLPPLHNETLRYFEKFFRLIQRTRNALAGRGFQTFEDVFGRFQSGEMAKRPLHERGPSFLRQEGVYAAPLGQGRTREFGDRPGPSLRQRAGEAAERAVPSFVEHFQDLNAPTRAIAEKVAPGWNIPVGLDPYAAKRLLPGKVAAREADFHDLHVKPLAAYMKANGITRQDAAEWLYAMHAAERNNWIDHISKNPTGMGSGWSNAKAAQIIADFRQAGLEPQMKEISRRVRRMRDFILDAWETSQLVDAETIDTLRRQYKNYVPLRGWDDPSLSPEEARELQSSQMSVRGKEYKAALGRKSTSDDPLANIVDMAYRAINRSEKNLALLTTANFFRMLPAQNIAGVVRFDAGRIVRKFNKDTGLVQGYYTPPWMDPDVAKRAVPYKENGKTHYMIFDSQLEAEALMRLKPDQVPMVLRHLNGLVNFYKTMMTHYNPEFMVRHFMVRYPIEAFFNQGEYGPGAMVRSFKGYPIIGPAFKAIRRYHNMTEAQRNSIPPEDEWARYYHEMRQHGGLMQFERFGGVEEIKTRMDRSLASVQAAASKGPAARAKAAARAAADKAVAFHEGISHLTNAMDNAQRLATYVEARKAGRGTAQAAMEARNATVDFTLRGRKANFFPYTPLVGLFGNTAIQTGARLVSASRRSASFRRWAIGGAMTLGVAAAILAYSAGSDKNGKPFIESTIPGVRRLNMMLPTFAKDQKDRPYFAMVALPYNHAGSYSMGFGATQLALSQMGIAKEKPSEIVANMIHAALEGLGPMPQEETLGGKFFPEILRSPYHIAANVNWLGVPVHPPEEPWNKGVPYHLQAKTGTPAFYKWMAGKLFWSTGVDIYPNDIQEVLSPFVGAYERIGTRAVEAIKESIVTGKPFPSDVPIAHVFMAGGKQYDQADYHAFRSMKTELYGAEHALAALRKGGDKAAAREYLETHKPELSAASILHSADKALTPLNKRLQEIEADAIMTWDRKKLEQDSIFRQQVEIMNKARVSAEKRMEQR